MVYKKVNAHLLYNAGEIQAQFFFPMTSLRASADTDNTCQDIPEIIGYSGVTRL